MIKFYKLAKIDDGDTKRIEFVREEGIFLPNNYAMELAVYRTEDKKTWYVVELTSGAGLGQGNTKSKAIANFEHNVERLGIKGIERAVNRSIELYGRTPDHEETEVF